MAERYGLRCAKTGEAVLPYRIDVLVKIRGFVADVQSTLWYRNSSGHSLEDVVFVFPVDHLSAVYQFEADVGDRVITAEVQEKDQAYDTYYYAFKDKRTSFILNDFETQVGRNCFYCHVGSLPRNDDAIVTLSYITELMIDVDRAVKFVLPTILHPRYGRKTEAIVQNGGSHYHKPLFHDEADDCDFKFVANLNGPFRIRYIKSDRVKLKIHYLDGEETQAEVTLCSSSLPNNQNLILYMYYCDIHYPHLAVERGGTEKVGVMRHDVLMLNFYPDVHHVPIVRKAEFIFVIDRSDKMAGVHFEDARKTLLLFLKSLPVGCYFNVIGFGDTIEAVFDGGGRAYNQATLSKAMDVHDTMNPNLGGKDLIMVLKYIYKQLKQEDSCPRQIFLLTDGDVQNQREVIELVRRHSDEARVFPFGIGEDVFTSFIKTLAKAGKGRPEFVKSLDTLEQKVMSSLRCAMQPEIRNMDVKLQLPGEVIAHQIPQKLPSLLAGDRLLVYVLMKHKFVDSYNGRCFLKGDIGGVEFQYTLEFNVEGAVTNEGLIHRLAAKTQITELEDNEDELEVPAKEPDYTGNQYILLLSKAANIISRYTAFVGIDSHGQIIQLPQMQQTEERFYRVLSADLEVDDEMWEPHEFVHALGYRPSHKSELGCSFGDLFKSVFKRQSPKRKSKQNGHYAQYPSHRRRRRHGPPPIADLADDMRVSNVSLNRPGSRHSTPVKVRKLAQPAREYLLIRLQTFEGSWLLDPTLVGIFGTTVDDVARFSPLQDIDLWTTIVALVWLQSQNIEGNDWELIKTKAICYICEQDLEGFSLHQLLRQAAIFIGHDFMQSTASLETLLSDINEAPVGSMLSLHRSFIQLPKSSFNTSYSTSYLDTTLSRTTLLSQNSSRNSLSFIDGPEPEKPIKASVETLASSEQEKPKNMDSSQESSKQNGPYIVYITSV